MKKIIITLIFASAVTTLSAQSTETQKSTQFNKWSVELAGGFNKPQRPMSANRATSTPSPYVVDLGVRYMFNNKFGLKADLGYNSFTERENSPSFDTKYYRVDLQGVANLGRIMSFETWTNTIGLLAHTGFGVGSLDFNGPKNDKMINFIAGVTAQVKLSNRFVLTGDATTIINSLQDRTFDGAVANTSRGFSGILFNGTIGLTYYLGKNVKHADWTIDNEDVIKSLNDRIGAIESKMVDADNDGVANYLDTEPNTPAGAMVDTKGKAIDKNNNGVPDQVEDYISKNTNTTDKSNVSNNELIKNLINDGYVCTYFDFNKSTPTNVSTDGIDFILTYLRNNPSASVDIIGHADEIGRSAYNDKLSNNRAKSVKNTLIKAKIDASRLNIIGAGEDKSVENAEISRKLVRRVTFRVK